MAEQPPNVRLNLASTPENVVLVREMLSGVAASIALDAGDLNDIRTAVTEACNNAVLHAYAGQPGPLEIELCVGSQELVVLVRDYGRGLRDPQQTPEGMSSGIGLHVIQTLSRDVELRGNPSGGTEVRMMFHAPAIRIPKPSPSNSNELPTLALTGSPATMTVSITPFELARTVLPRMMSALAARAHFSTDRISDMQLLADALVAHAHVAMSGNHFNVGVDIKPRNLELRIAPLEAGRAQKLISDSKLDGLGKVIEKLTDRRDIASTGSYETLTLGVVDRH
jgi:serine/threonine-protein kinase RsbW